MKRTPQQWQTLFQAQTDSGLSIKKFCFEQSIPTSSFYKNKSILKTAVIPISSTTLSSPFSQVLRAEPYNQNAPHEIKLNVGKVELTLDGKTDVRWLANLVGQLA
jgi:hypothetical protein